MGAEVANSGPGAPYSTGNSANVLPSATVSYVKGSNILTSAVDYGHSKIGGTTKETETALVNYRFKPFKQDATSLSLSQKYAHTSNDAASSYVRTFQSSLDNVHLFNDKGMALTTVLYFLHNNSPVFSDLDGTHVALRTKMNIPVGLVALNIPLPIEGMSCLVGYQYQFIRLNYDFDLDGKLESPSVFPQLPIEGNFDISSHHVWSSLSYVLQRWKFDVGCRSIMTSYRSEMNMEKVKKRSNNYWLWNVSAIYMPNFKQQVQLAYVRRYINPSYANFDLRDMLNSSPLMGNVNLYDDKFRNTLVDQVKLSYRRQWNQFSLQGNMGYIHLDGFVKPVDARTQWIVNDTWMGEALACWNGKLLNVVAGASYYTNEYRTDDSSDNIHTPYAVFRLVPSLFLPSRWQVRLQTLFFTKCAPLYQLTNNSVYASLRVNKQIGKHLDLYAQWHDIFYGSHGYVLGGIDVRF